MSGEKKWFRPEDSPFHEGSKPSSLKKHWGKCAIAAALAATAYMTLSDDISIDELFSQLGLKTSEQTASNRFTFPSPESQ